MRHAQGHHNVDPRPIHERAADATLTPEGEAQCDALAAAVCGVAPGLIVANPLTRTLQTGTRAFAAQLGAGPAPLVVCEHARETVNFLCDCRRCGRLGRQAAQPRARPCYLPFSPGARLFCLLLGIARPADAGA